MGEPLATIGDNNPPSLTQVLSEAYADLQTSVEAVAGDANNVPKKILTDADLDACGIVVVASRTLRKTAESFREKEKAPFLLQGREVDGFFKSFTERLEKIEAVLNERATVFQRAKAAEARRIADEEARRLREEERTRREAAARAEAEQREAHRLQHNAKADEAAADARRAETMATAKPAEQVRQRMTSGTVATAATEWVFDIEDYDAIDLEKLRPYIKRDAIEAAIRAAVKMQVRTLAGVRIYEDIRGRFV